MPGVGRLESYEVRSPLLRSCVHRTIPKALPLRGRFGRGMRSLSFRKLRVARAAKGFENVEFVLIAEWIST